MVNFSAAVVLALAGTTVAKRHHHHHRHAAAVSKVETAAVSKVETASSKRGIAYDLTKFANAFEPSQCSWAWNWKSKQGDYGFDGSIPSGMEYVPMLYDEASAGSFSANVDLALGSGTAHVLGFNEIDQCGGGGTCIDTTTAATLYAQYMKPLVGKVKIGSPSVTSDQNPASGKGVPALVKWKQACGDNCPVDFWQLHWYGGGGDAETEAEALMTFITDFAAPKLEAAVGKTLPIWITEFAPAVDVASITEAQHTAFIQAVIPKLEACEQVERYSYFMAAPAYLNNADGTLSIAGSAYIS